MPRVASEADSVPPSRSHPASGRSPSQTNSKPAASPFTEMLDSAAPSAEPASRQARTGRLERADRTDKPKLDRPKVDRTTSDKAIGDRSAAAKPARHSAGANDSKAADSGGAGTAKKSQDANARAAAASTSADSNPESDPSTAPDAMFVDTANSAVAVAQAVVHATTQTAGVIAAPALSPPANAAEAGALASLPAVAGLRISADAALTPAQGERVTPQPAANPTQGQVQAQNDKTGGRGDAPAAAAPAIEPQIAPPRLEPAKDSDAGGDGDKTVAEFHRSVAELTARLAPDAPVPDSGDAVGVARAPADAVQSAGALTPVNAPNAAAAVSPAHTQGQVQAAAVPLAGLAVEIVSQAHAGKNHFEIRLDPPELGRIDVKLDVDRDGNVSTRLVVDRADTLDLLKRDAASLERALTQAGLKTSDHGLDFSLRQHAFTEHDATAQPGARVMVPENDTAPLEALRQGYGRLLGLGGGLDIRV